VSTIDFCAPLAWQLPHLLESPAVFNPEKEVEAEEQSMLGVLLFVAI